MRSYPNPDDLKDLERLNAKPWQIELLKKNPEYVYWGNHEDYMSDKDGGWRAPAEFDTIEGLFGLDELNELVNFYFEIYRKSHECPHCDGRGLNPATKKISDDWYAFDNPRYINVDANYRYNDNAWSHHITDVEVEALVKGGRISDVSGFNGWFEEETQQWYSWINGVKTNVMQPEYPTAESVNNWSKSRGLGHDSINQWICVKARAKHLGVYGYCEHCEGHGHIFDAPEASVGLQLWYLHPRKGAARGVYIKNVQEHEVPQVIAYLKEAAERNANRFSKL